MALPWNILSTIFKGVTLSLLISFLCCQSDQTKNTPLCFKNTIGEYVYSVYLTLLCCLKDVYINCSFSMCFSCICTPLLLLGLPMCSLGIMKDAWDRFRQCISPTTSLSQYGSNTLPILNQVFEFVCGSLVHLPASSPTWHSEQTCAQADPKAITCAILHQQQRAEVILLFMLYNWVIFYL